MVYEFTPDVAYVDGLPVVCGTIADTALGLTAASNLGFIRLVNAYTFQLRRRPSKYSVNLQEGVNLPDGRPLTVYLSLVSRGSMQVEQMRGADLLCATLRCGVAPGTRHYFLGGTPQALSGLLSFVGQTYPDAIVAGSEAPPFGELAPDEARLQDARIAATRPDIVWVGLGTPKQDYEGVRLASVLEVTTVGIGAAFDFLAGTRPSAPALLSRLGLEWLFRLASEPRRLWRRYLLGNAGFLAALVRDAFARGTHQRGRDHN